jgi:hypothetical protein
MIFGHAANDESWTDLDSACKHRPRGDSAQQMTHLYRISQDEETAQPKLFVSIHALQL